jgi:hypothetical protein
MFRDGSKNHAAVLAPTKALERSGSNQSLVDLSEENSGHASITRSALSADELRLVAPRPAHRDEAPATCLVKVTMANNSAVSADSQWGPTVDPEGRVGFALEERYLAKGRHWSSAAA